MQRFGYSYITATLLLILSAPILALAQDAALLKPDGAKPDRGEAPTELIIRGASVERSEFTLPQSITVIDLKDPYRPPASSIQDTLQYLPNFNWAGGTARPRFMQVRGVGEFEQYSGAPNPSVGAIVDDIDFSGLGIFTSLFDAKQIELLRGPQAIRFGSSALAGVLNITSEDPSPNPSGRILLSSGNDEMTEGGIAAGGRLIPGNNALSFRLSINHHSQDGFRDNDFLLRDDTNYRDETTARIKFRYEPDSTLRVDLTGIQVDNNNGYDLFAIDNSLTTQSDKPGSDDIQAEAGALKILYRPGEVEVTAITTGYQTDQDYSFDGDWGNNPFWEPYAPYDYFEITERDRSFFAQELRVASPKREYLHGESVRWLAGVLGSRLSEDSSTDQLSDSIAFSSIDSDYSAKTGAAFGEVEVPLSNDTALTFGARSEYRSMEYTDSRESDLSPDDLMWGGSITLDSQVGSTLLYGSVTRGFKGGGINPGPQVSESRREYDPESQVSFEIGAKGSWLENKLRGSVSVFHAIRDDLQLKLAIQDDPSDPLSFTYITESRGEGESDGAEVEMRYLLTERVELLASGGLLLSEFTKVPTELSELDGRSFSHAPEWQYSLGTTWKIVDPFFITAEVSGSDTFYFDDSHNQSSKPYHLVNLTAGMRSGDLTWTIWGKNLFDDEYATRGFFFGNEPPDFPSKLYIQRGDPRTIGTSITYIF